MSDDDLDYYAGLATDLHAWRHECAEDGTHYVAIPLGDGEVQRLNLGRGEAGALKAHHLAQARNMDAGRVAELVTEVRRLRKRLAKLEAVARRALVGSTIGEECGSFDLRALARCLDALDAEGSEPR